MNICIALGVILLIVSLVDIAWMIKNPDHRRRGWYERLGWGKYAAKRQAKRS